MTDTNSNAQLSAEELWAEVSSALGHKTPSAPPASTGDDAVGDTPAPSEKDDVSQDKTDEDAPGEKEIAGSSEGTDKKDTDGNEVAEKHNQKKHDTNKDYHI